MKPISLFLTIVFFPFLFIGSTFANTSGDLFFDTQKTKYLPESPMVSKPLKVYLHLKNTSGEDMKGVVRGYNLTDGKKIEIEQPFTTIANGTADVFLEFLPEKEGVHELNFRIIPWEKYESNDVSNDKIIQKVFIDTDLDTDGIPDQLDTDDDNDGVSDKKDAFPRNEKEWKDTDRDGRGDNSDPDDDNDGVIDEKDAFPLDPKESIDTDSDGKGDNADKDDDGDGISDVLEEENRTDPKNADTDFDGLDDALDEYPLDKKFQYDTDKDGIPNAKDTDDDDDGVNDEKDAFPLNPKEWKDFDQDGVGDNNDLDDDNDHLPDVDEAKRNTDPKNPDTDADGEKDGVDAFPLDPKEWKDSDQDGLGDNADPNNENKGPVLVLPEEKLLEVGRNEVFTLDASSSYDPEGGELSYTWNLLENGELIATRNTPVFQAIFPSLGQQTVQLIVTDLAEESRVQEFSVQVFLPTKDIIFVISFFVLLHIVGFGIYFFRKRKKRRR